MGVVTLEFLGIVTIILVLQGNHCGACQPWVTNISRILFENITDIS